MLYINQFSSNLLSLKRPFSQRPIKSPRRKPDQSEPVVGQMDQSELPAAGATNQDPSLGASAAFVERREPGGRASLLRWCDVSVRFSVVLKWWEVSASSTLIKIWYDASVRFTLMQILYHASTNFTLILILYDVLVRFILLMLCYNISVSFTLVHIWYNLMYSYIDMIWCIGALFDITLMLILKDVSVSFT